MFKIIQKPLNNNLIYKFNYSKYAAFSLIELSISLVVMGIFISGVVGGYSLIRSAKSRAIINETGKLETALYAYYAATGNLPASNLSDRIYYNFSCNVFKSLYDENIDQSHIRKVETCDSNSSTINNEQQFHSKDHSLIYTVGYNEPRKKNIVFLLSNDSSAQPETIETLQNVTYLDENRKTQDTQNIKLNTASVTIKLAKEIDTKMDDGVYNTGKVQSFSASNRPNDEVCEYYKDSNNTKGDVLNNNNALFYKLHKDNVNCVPSFAIAVGSEYSKKQEEEVNTEEGEFCTISPRRIDNSTWKLSNGNSISSKVKIGQTITAYCNDGYYNSQSASNEDNTNDNIPVMNATCSEGGTWNYGSQTGECYKYCLTSNVNSEYNLVNTTGWSYNNSNSIPSKLKEGMTLSNDCIDGYYYDINNNENGKVYIKTVDISLGLPMFASKKHPKFNLLCNTDGSLTYKFGKTAINFSDNINGCYKKYCTRNSNGFSNNFAFLYNFIREDEYFTNNYILDKSSLVTSTSNCPNFNGKLTCDGTTGNWISNGGNFSCHVGYKDCFGKMNLENNNIMFGYYGKFSENLLYYYGEFINPFIPHGSQAQIKYEQSYNDRDCYYCDNIRGAKPRATRTACTHKAYASHSVYNDDLDISFYQYRNFPNHCTINLYCCNGEYHTNPCS